jgi:hypothetical protein
MIFLKYRGVRGNRRRSRALKSGRPKIHSKTGWRSEQQIRALLLKFGGGKLRTINHGDSIMKFAANMIAGFGLVAGIGLMTPAVGLAQSAMTSTTTTTTTSSTEKSGATAGDSSDMSSDRQNGRHLPGKTIQALQETLRGEGYDVSNNGVWGPDLVAGLRHYQQDSGLPVTGELDHATRAKLHLKEYVEDSQQ